MLISLAFRNGWTTVAPATGASVDILREPFDVVTGSDGLPDGAGAPIADDAPEKTHHKRESAHKDVLDSDEPGTLSRSAVSTYERDAR